MSDSIFGMIFGDDFSTVQLKASKLHADKADLIAALEHLLAKPSCSACRKAVRATIDRIKKGE